MTFFIFLAVVLLLPGCNLFDDLEEKVEDKKPGNPSNQFPVIQLPDGYQIEKVAGKLTYPTSVTWDDQGRMYVVEAGGAFMDQQRLPES